MRARTVLAAALLTAVLGAEEGPPDVDYGPYDHFLESKGEAELRSRSIKLMQKLRGLYQACPKCRARGEIEVVLRERYYDNLRGEWIPAVKEWQACPRCNRDKWVFDERVADGFLKAAFPSGSLRSSAGRMAERRWKETLEACRVGFNKTPRLRYEVSARYGVVKGPRVPLFPLHFHYVRTGNDYEWYVHDPELDGPFDFGSGPGLPSQAKVVRAHAGDVLELEGGTVVRVCGIVVPGTEGKIATRRVSEPDPVVRDEVAKLVEGRVVDLETDKYAQVTVEGHPIAFVKIEDQDLGEQLLTRGLVRCHPKHRHERYGTYRKAERAARNADVGVWADEG